MSFTGLHDFYQSIEWRRCREAVLGGRLLRDGELRCERCGKAILHPYEAVLHHVDELDEAKVQDPAVALNPDNLMLVCHRCHSEIHAPERKGRGFLPRSRHVYLVWGCPCSGKREFVDSARGDRDIVVDIDSIFDSLGGERGAVKSEALAMYRTAVDMIRVRGGRWHNAWVIRTLPRSSDRERLQRDLGGAEEMHVERPAEECRAEARKRGGDWPEWVENWLESQA